MYLEPKPWQANGLEDRFQLLIDSIEIDGIYMLDCSGHVMTWNRGAEINKGYKEAEILGKHYKIFFIPEDINADVPAKNLAIAARSGRLTGEGWRLRKNGERFWASFVLTVLQDAEGHVIGFAKVIRDLTEQKKQTDALHAAQAALIEERDRLRAVAESSLDALFVCEALRNRRGQIEDFVFTYLNSNVSKLISIPRNIMLGGRMCELLPLNRTIGLFEKYKEVVLSGDPLIVEFPIEDDDVNCSWLRIQAVKLHDGVAITASDITERKRREQDVEYRAQHDTLTGLPNRSLLEDRLDRAIAYARCQKAMAAVLLIDLDGFKQVNDKLGHTTGDEVLCIIARRLRNILRATDALIRLGGDEFVAIAEDIHGVKELIPIVDKIMDTMRPPILCGSHKVLLTCSIGIAVYPDSATHSLELLKRADVAMYASKNAGKNQYKFFGQRSTKNKETAKMLPFKARN
jgi:diguanylate cyclase (GGDEF)-like protein/PAS domain S-box-containing protein